MAINNVLQRGSYNGVDFLFSTNSQESGRKLAIFEYPESDIRTAQDLGKFLPVYDLNITVTGGEDNYLQNRARFINALNTPANIFLLRNNKSTNFVHPIDGNVRATAGKYTITEDISELGISKFRVKFYAIKEVIYPTQSTSNASNIDNIFDDVLNDIRDGFEKIWSVIIDFENDLAKARLYINDIANVFRGIPSLVNIIPDSISSFLDQIDNLENSVLSIAQVPSELSSSISGLFDQMQNITTTTNNKTIINNQFFSYNTGVQYPLNTDSRINSEKNRKSINTFINSMALTHEIYNTSISEYTNTDDINKQVSKLRDQHKYIIDNNFYLDENSNSNNIFDEDVVDNITKMHDYAIGYLQEQKANAKNVKEISVVNNNMLNIVYAYYNNTSEYDDINLLNDVGDPSQITGEFKVLI